MTNEGQKLTQQILKDLGFEKEVFKEDFGDEIKWWILDGIYIHESSWWLTELDHNGNFLETPKSYYEEGEEEPEITFNFAVYVKGNGGFKSGYPIKTDQQLKNLIFSLTGKMM